MRSHLPVLPCRAGAQGSRDVTSRFLFDSFCAVRSLNTGREDDMYKKTSTILIVSLLITFLVVSCRKPKNDSGEGEGPEQNAKPAYSSKGDEGSITGVINFEGTAPAPQRIAMGGDANCASTSGDKMTENYVVTDGKVANVFVYVTGGPANNFSFEIPSSPVVLDQLGCRYDPHVLGLQANQTLKITNSDQATHNIHPYPKANKEWNESQPAGAAPKEKKFPRPETLIPVKCNQHPWMQAYIGVLPHPFFAVSAKDGSYTIKDLPPGKYTLVAWHEQAGEQKQEITVGAKESKTQNFTYKSGSAYAPSSLSVQPALILP